MLLKNLQEFYNVKDKNDNLDTDDEKLCGVYSGVPKIS